MITRKMNERITFLERKYMKDENGDLIDDDKVLFSCWAEVPKTTTKEFRDRSSEGIEEMKKRKTRKVFYIRFRNDVDTGLHVEWRNEKYEVVDIGEDWQSKDMLMITCEVIK